MLVLSRKYGEDIVIGDNIRIRVVEIDRDKVRLAIIAPREVKILRQELMPHDDSKIRKRISKGVQGAIDQQTNTIGDEPTSPDPDSQVF